MNVLWANSGDLDQTSHFLTSYPDLHYLHVSSERAPGLKRVKHVPKLTVKMLRIYGRIIGNQLPVHVQLFLRESVKISHTAGHDFLVAFLAGNIQRIHIMQSSELMTDGYSDGRWLQRIADGYSDDGWLL